MRHNYVPSDDSVMDPGFWAVGRQADKMRIVVDVASRGVCEQTRLLLSIPRALRLAADLIDAASEAGDSLCAYDSADWTLEINSEGIAITFRNNGEHWLDAESRLVMTALDASEMAGGILRRVGSLILNEAEG